MAADFDNISGEEAKAFLKRQAEIHKRARRESSLFNLDVRRIERRGNALEELVKYKKALWQFAKEIESGFPGQRVDDWPEELQHSVKYIQQLLIQKELMPDVPEAARMSSFFENKVNEELQRIAEGREDILAGAPRILELRDQVKYLAQQLRETKRTEKSTAKSLSDTELELTSKIEQYERETVQLMSELSSKIDDYVLLSRKYEQMKDEHKAERSRFSRAYKKAYDWIQNTKGLLVRLTRDDRKKSEYAARLEVHNENLARDVVHARREARTYKRAFWLAVVAAAACAGAAAMSYSQDRDSKKTIAYETP